jgi:hypothetical protein
MQDAHPSEIAVWRSYKFYEARSKNQNARFVAWMKHLLSQHYSFLFSRRAYARIYWFSK